MDANDICLSLSTPDRRHFPWLTANSAAHCRMQWRHEICMIPELSEEGYQREINYTID
jgi:hypothetical protein